MTSINRTANRLIKRIPIRFGLDKPNNLGFIKNMSLKGVAISSRVIFDPPTKISMLIEHNRQDIDLSGQVRWSIDGNQIKNRLINDGLINFDMGVEFLNRSDKYIDLLADLVGHFDEVRRERRFEMILRVTFETPEEIFNEYTNNISHGGMFIATRNPPQLDMEVEVQLFLGCRLEFVQARARVVHIVTDEMAEKIGLNPGIGIQFTGFIGDSEKRFSEFISDLKQKFSEV